MSCALMDACWRVHFRSLEQSFGRKRLLTLAALTLRFHLWEPPGVQFDIFVHARNGRLCIGLASAFRHVYRGDIAAVCAGGWFR